MLRHQEICSLERIHSQGSLMRTIDLKSASLKAGSMEYLEKQGGLRCRQSYLEVGKRWGNLCSVQAYLNYMLLHGMHVQKIAMLAWSEDGVLGPLMSKGHSLDTYMDLVWGSGFPWPGFPLPSSNWSSADFQFLKNSLSNHYYSNPSVICLIKQV